MKTIDLIREGMDLDKQGATVEEDTEGYGPYVITFADGRRKHTPWSLAGIHRMIAAHQEREYGIPIQI